MLACHRLEIVPTSFRVAAEVVRIHTARLSRWNDVLPKSFSEWVGLVLGQVLFRMSQLKM